MACEARLRKGQTLAERNAEVDRALKELEAQLKAKRVTVGIAPNGAVVFNGWQSKDRSDLSDVCAYRSLMLKNSWELRQAVAAAEMQARRKVNPLAVAAGWHSHNNGVTWGKH